MKRSQISARETAKKILVIVDSPVQALSLVNLLESEGLHALCAPNAERGIRVARAQSPDLIILDIELPKMNGLGACRVLKRDDQTKNIPIILLTAHDEIDFVKEGLDKGAVDFIPKDRFCDTVLINSIHQLGIIGSARR